MPHLRTLMTLPIAAATALVVAAPPASAAPVTTGAAAKIQITQSPFLDLPLDGTCPGTPLKEIVALQWVNWMWAPLTLDNPDATPLPQVLIPHQMSILEGSDNLPPELRARHDLAPTAPFTAPGPKPKKPTTCTFQVHGGQLRIEVTGTLVTIPKRLDAILPPVKPKA